ncbi:MAG TPA: glycosyltransferase [Pseudomonadales bacterium]|nr:glycosyltransferase [Pseudomonadales bacterium]
MTQSITTVPGGLVKQAAGQDGVPKDGGLHVAVLFHRIGPYHYARLKAAGSRLRITAIEFSDVDRTYAWDFVQGTDGFLRRTLFSGEAVEELPGRRVVSRVHEVLDEVRPQVVAIPGWSDRCSLAAAGWCQTRSIPAVMMSESTEWDGKRNWWKEALKRQVVCPCSGGLVGGTPHKDYMVKLGMPAERMFLGYDAVDNRYFQEKTEMLKTEKLKIESRNKYGLPERYFLASARFVEKKNLSRLLQAYARYRQLAANGEIRNQRSEIRNKFQLSAFPISAFKNAWSLVLLGDGPLKPDLCHLIADLGLQHCVLLPGFKQYGELPVYYGLASAFVHASTTEQWGLVVNEAMASGLPVLVSNRCGCAMDLVKDGVNGFTFDPYDVEQLANLMSKISVFNFPLSEFGAESAGLISHWGPERFAEGLKSAAEKAIEVGPRGVGIVDRLLLKALIAR